MLNRDKRVEEIEILWVPGTRGTRSKEGPERLRIADEKHFVISNEKRIFIFQLTTYVITLVLNTSDLKTAFQG